MKKRYVERAYKKKQMNTWQIIALELTAFIWLVIVQTLALWTIDISISAIMTEAMLGHTIMLTNGFSMRDPLQMYHVGIYLVVMTTFMMAILMVFCALRTYKKNA